MNREVWRSRQEIQRELLKARFETLVRRLHRAVDKLRSRRLITLAEARSLSSIKPQRDDEATMRRIKNRIAAHKT